MKSRLGLLSSGPSRHSIAQSQGQFEDSQTHLAASRTRSQPLSGVSSTAYGPSSDMSETQVQTESLDGRDAGSDTQKKTKSRRPASQFISDLTKDRRSKSDLLRDRYCFPTAAIEGLAVSLRERWQTDHELQVLIQSPKAYSNTQNRPSPFLRHRHHICAHWRPSSVRKLSGEQDYLLYRILRDWD